MFEVQNVDLLCTQLLTVVGSTCIQLYVSLAKMFVLPPTLLFCLISAVVSEKQPYVITITFLGYYNIFYDYYV